MLCKHTADPAMESDGARIGKLELASKPNKSGLANFQLKRNAKSVRIALAITYATDYVYVNPTFIHNDDKADS